VLVNLISNAIKFCPFGGTVSLLLGYDDRAQLLNIEVWNDGKSIPEGELPMIFNPFYRAGNAQTQGSGIGLALVKELVENMNGSIVAVSDSVNGNKFSVCIPLQKTVAPEFQQEDSPLCDPSATEFGSHLHEPPPASFRILIIEDDEDMREYLSGSFAPASQIVTASNGEIGFEIASQILPDIVICDIMMPGSDGIACCEKLKSDQRTDHIPIILLTAKTGLADRLNGLRAGADDYITKPFSSDELRMKVNNLVNQRNQLKLRFGRHIQSTYKDLPMKSADERFLDKALAIIHAQIGNADFNITQFSSSMNLSRTHLHKKLKVITGQSPSEFIRNLRLQRAAELLAADTDQVSPIAYDTGFNSLSHFTRMFKAKYGVPPTEYKRQTFLKSHG
jgi:DNA-binding response OmpR family regulator